MDGWDEIQKLFYCRLFRSSGKGASEGLNVKRRNSSYFLPCRIVSPIFIHSAKLIANEKGIE